jgi:hypothetical protein
VTAVAEQSRVIHELCPKGDTRVEWNPNDPVSVAAARQAFNMLKDKRQLLYSEDSRGRRTQIREFDPNAERIVAVPQTAGG